MKRLIIFDGIDNTGKTSVINELVKLSSRKMPIISCHFPSNKLAKSKEFKEIATYPDRFSAKVRWFDVLYEEELKVLSKLLLRKHNRTQILVDRMWISTLIYQGNSIKDNFRLERIINQMYLRLMGELGLRPSQVDHIIFKNPLTKTDPTETSEAKIAFDLRQKKYYTKLLLLLEALRAKVRGVSTPFLRFSNYVDRIVGNITIFDENQNRFLKGYKTPERVIASIQKKRLGRIFNFIRARSQW
jgi:hypothetical protein